MRIDHIAIWTHDIERMKNFYVHYFDAGSNDGYFNHSKEFHSYFLTFGGDCRLELMQMPSITNSRNDYRKQYIGIVHFSIKVGSRTKVDQLARQLKEDGFEVISNPRTTGEGYYETVVLDPEKNRLEIIA